VLSEVQVMTDPFYQADASRCGEGYTRQRRVVCDLVHFSRGFFGCLRRECPNSEASVLSSRNGFSLSPLVMTNGETVVANKAQRYRRLAESV
jgi:hypothetical protein